MRYDEGTIENRRGSGMGKNMHSIHNMHGMHGIGSGEGFRQRGFVGLKYWIVSLVSKKEMTGAQIMDALEEMSMGRWRPSPGNVYPALKQLETDGYVKIREEGAQKYYSMTAKGNTLLSNFMPRAQHFGSNIAKETASKKDMNEIFDAIEEYAHYLKDNANEIKADKNKNERLKKLALDLSNITE
jgi:DNA-binding PadR family transcriptional regulator